MRWRWQPLERPAAHPGQRRRHASGRSGAETGGRLLPGDDGRSRGAGIDPAINPRPNEVDPAIPFAEDREHRSYDAEAVRLFWRQLIQADRVLNEFRSRFIGKVSRVHYFWGAPDLACTRFSGRSAPVHPGGAPNCGDWVMVEGYSHELSSCGFWAGGGEEGAFYADAKAKGAHFLTEPLDRKAEIRCYMRDPDGYLIEVGEATGLLEGILADR